MTLPVLHWRPAFRAVRVEIYEKKLQINFNSPLKLVFVYALSIFSGQTSND